MNVQQAYIIAKRKANYPQLKIIVQLPNAFGFLFSPEETVYGNNLIVVDKDGDVTSMAMNPQNIKKVQSAKQIPLSVIKIK